MSFWGVGGDFDNDAVSGSGTYPRYALAFAEAGTADDVIAAQDVVWGFIAPTSVSGTDAKFVLGIMNGALPATASDIDIANFSGGIVAKTDRVTVKPGIVLDPTTTTLAPDTLGSLMYDSGSDELKYYDGSWQIISAGGLSSHALDGIYHTATGLTAGDILSADSATTFSWKANPGGTDGDAIHDNVANEITAITPKTTLAAADELVLEDSAASFVKKAVTFANIESSISLANLGVRTHASLSDAPTDAHHVRYADSEVETVITAEIVDGQSIDNAIDALITTHNVTNNHLDWTASVGTIHTDNYLEYTDAAVESVITAEIVDGQSIDLAIDALILTHKNLPAAHHAATVAGDLNHNDLANIDAGDINHLTDAQVTALHATYTDGDVESVITAEIVDGQSIDNAIDSLISTHASDDNAHHEVFESGDFTTAFAAESLANLATRTHGSLSDAPEDAHHVKVHALVDATNHPESGLTTGHFLKATGTTSYAFGAHGLTASDVSAAADPHGQSAHSGDVIPDSDQSFAGQLAVSGTSVVLVDLRPSATGTQSVIEITPTEAITSASADWRGIYVNTTALDPTNTLVDIWGMDLDLAFISQAQNPDITGLEVGMPASYTSSGTIYAATFGGDGRSVQLCTTDFAIATTGEVSIGTINAATSDLDKFVVSDSGEIKFRTGSEAYSDMDGYTSSDFTSDFSGESLANLTTRTHASLSDAPTDAHHTESHDFDTHSGNVDLTDLSPTGAAQGGIIKYGPTDWEILARATEGKFLRTGAADIAWGDVDWSDLVGTQPSPISHDLTGDHTENATGGAGNFLKADGATTFSWQAHGLGASDVGAYTTAQVDTAIDTDITTHTGDDNAHHEVFESGDFTTAFAAETLGNLATRAHANLSDSPEDAHHAKVHTLIDATNHPESGLTAGHFLKATGTTTYAFGAHGLSASDVGAYTTAQTDSAIDTDISTHAGDDNAHHEVIETSDVESIITTELVDGQSIDAAIDALILTHKNLSAEHHTKYTTVESESVITAELVEGQSIDNAIDALILTHKNIAGDHHAKYLDSEAVAAVEAANPLTLTYDLSIQGGDVLAPASLNMKVSGDTSDFWYFSTVSNVAKIIPIDNNVHDIGTSGLRARMVYTYQLSDGTNEPTIAQISSALSGTVAGTDFTVGNGGAIYVGNTFVGFTLPDSDANAFGTCRFQLPATWPGTTGVLHIVVAIEHATNTFSWTLTMKSIDVAGEAWGGTLILNSTSNDITGNGTSLDIQIEEVSLTSLAAGDTLSMRFTSDASNANSLYVLGAYIEVT